MSEQSVIGETFLLTPAAKEWHDENILADPDASSNVKLTAFVSCYNEAQFIVQTFDDIRQALDSLGITYEIVVIDDCSTDGSSALIADYVARHPDVPIVFRRNRVNKGLAQNYVDASFIGRGKYIKLFCGDNTEPIESIRVICRAIGNADIVSPYYSSVVGKPQSRMFISRTYTALVNMVSGNRLRYYNGLAVHRRYNVMRWHPNSRGFGFQADIMCMLLGEGLSIIEVPVPAINRAPSRALTIKNVLSVGHTLLKIVLRRMANRVYRKK